MVSEFQFINHIKKRFSLDRVGDDCAVLPQNQTSDLLITADLLVEDIDFRLDWTTPGFLGHKALAVSLSDIAAMGGTPTSAMLSIGVPQKLWDNGFPEAFYDSWNKLASQFGVELIGGDTSRSPDKIVIDSIVLGEVPKDMAILRSGARPGDTVFVSGTLGAAAAGLRLLESGASNSNNREANLIERQLRPSPQVELGKWLRELGLVTAMIDISDGLSSDLSHICQSSSVGALIDAELIPIDTDLAKVMRFEEAFELSLNGGEDFELLFSVPNERSFELIELPVTRIGTITAVAGKVELKRGETKTQLEPNSFRHF